MHKHLYLHSAFNSTRDDDAGQKGNLMYLSARIYLPLSVP